jgi:hypothetical protein
MPLRKMWYPVPSFDPGKLEVEAKKKSEMPLRKMWYPVPSFDPGKLEVETKKKSEAK